MYEFKCFPYSRNLVINHDIIGNFEILEKFEKLLIDFEGGSYEVLDSSDDRLKLKQNNLIFVIDRMK